MLVSSRSTRSRSELEKVAMHVKTLIMVPGLVIFIMLAIGTNILGMPDLPRRLRMQRGVLMAIAMSLIMIGAYWR